VLKKQKKDMLVTNIQTQNSFGEPADTSESSVRNGGSEKRRRSEIMNGVASGAVQCACSLKARHEEEYQNKEINH
jgi:hypothetical protein